MEKESIKEKQTFSLISLFYLMGKSPLEKFLPALGIFILFYYLGLYDLLFGLGIKKLDLFTAPFLWVILELVRTKSEIGLPWVFRVIPKPLYSFD